MDVSLSEQLNEATEIADVTPAKAIEILEAVIASEKTTEDDLKARELAIYKLGEIHAKLGDAEQLAILLKKIRPFFKSIPKAKTAKIVRSLIEFVSKIPDTVNLQIELCRESIAWTKEEKRTFLRHRIEAKLVQLYVESGKYNEAIQIITPLLREVKKMDDKPLLVEIFLFESIVHHKLRNIPKARASWTASRTAANAIYCPPSLQAEIDMQSGTIHADEKDYRTAYSYFFEAFEAYNNLSLPEAVKSLKYMLLCKIMTNNSEDVHSILTGKLALRYVGREVEAMRAVANAHRARSLKDFESVLNEFKAELKDDEMIASHISDLYEEMLSQNLCRIIEPYSCVEISHVAELISLDRTTVEKKLSQMILDKQFSGILDQGNGWLLLFEDVAKSGTYEASLDTIVNMGKVVDSLFDRAKELN